jgi:hypothetical protein
MKLIYRSIQTAIVDHLAYWSPADFPANCFLLPVTWTKALLEFVEDISARRWMKQLLIASNSMYICFW